MIFLNFKCVLFKYLDVYHNKKQLINDATWDDNTFKYIFLITSFWETKLEKSGMKRKRFLLPCIKLEYAKFVFII